MRMLPMLLFAAVAGGCVPAEPYLHWDRGSPAPVMQGRVAVKFIVDKREPKHGGPADPNNIGNWRGGFGNPFAIRVGTGVNQPLQTTVAQIVGEALAGSGIGMTAIQDPGASAHLSIEVLDFWCDGYMGYKATVSLALVLLDPASGGLRLRIPIVREGSADAAAGMWGPVSQQCKNAYRTALTGVYGDIVNAFLNPSVRAAALGAPPPPAQ